MSVIAALLLATAQPAPMCFKDCAISDTGVELIQHFEGYSPFPYKDVAGINTVGFGHVVRGNDHITYPLLPNEAEMLLKRDSGLACGAVNRAVAIPLAQSRFDALVSWTFNVGAGRLQTSTLLLRVNEGRHDEVRPQFLRWVNAGGQPVAGLRRRREAEADLYDRGKI